MNIDYLIQILSNKVGVLTTAKGQAFSAGNLDQINAIDKELLDTQNTLSQLSMVAHVAQVAKVADTTASDIVASGLNAIQNPEPVVQGPSASAVINGYDISAYATDPLYEDKVRAILVRIPMFSIVSDIDSYIQSAAQGSPVTGDMVYKASHQYGVDLPLMMAIMQNDSSFGTQGVGARTFNPGNVGNTGSAEKDYGNWQDGVFAVADWLNRHRVVVPTDPAPVTVPVVPVDSTATSTDATSTPTVTLPTTPVVTATSTAIFTIPSANATTTPPVATSTPPITATTTPPVIPPFNNASTTDATSTNATSTPPDTTGTSTPPTTGTTTPPVLDLGGLGNSTSTDATSTNATSTPPDTTASSTSPVNGTTTPPVLDLGNMGSSTTTDPVTSTTTDTTSSTTQAIGKIFRRKRV